METKMAGNVRGRVDVITYIGPVTEQMVTQLMDVTFQAKAAGSSEIRLLISSKGGDFSAGLAAYQHLTSLCIPLVAHNIGDISDEALMLYLAADTRGISWRSLFLIHQFQQEQDYQRFRSVFYERTKTDLPMNSTPGMLLSFDRDSALNNGITTEPSRPIEYPPSVVFWHIKPA